VRPTCVAFECRHVLDDAIAAPRSGTRAVSMVGEFGDAWPRSHGFAVTLRNAPRGTAGIGTV